MNDLDNSVRLYFIRLPESASSGEVSTDASGEILSAVTRNGLDYQLDADFKLPCRTGPRTRLIAATLGRRVHLFVVHSSAKPGGSDAAVEHLTSSDGRRFEPAEDARRSPFRELIDVEAAAHKLIAFVPSTAGLRSLTCEDGRRWKMEEGIRIADVGEAAVVQLKDQSHFMLYSAIVVEPAGGLPQLALAPEATTTPQIEPGTTSTTTTVAPVGTPDQANAGSGQADPVAHERNDWEPFEPANDDSVALPEWRDPNGASGRSAFDETAEWADPFPPLPDFNNPVDYWQWFRDQLPADVPDDAYPDYQALRQQWAAFMTGKEGVHDMFNSDYSGPIGPWDPAEHPDWEATHQALSGFLDQFSQSTWHQYMVEPLEPPADHHIEGGPLFMEILLPGLAENRAWSKAALADALRIENGKVPPQQTLDGLGTVLRNATLVQQQPTLIHSLVGIAEQSLAQSVARSALENGVFSTPEELAAAYNTLVKFDLPPADAENWLRFEEASMMQMAQYVVKPAGSEGGPQLDLDRLQTLGAMFINDPKEGESLLAILPQISIETIQYEVGVVDTMYRELADQMRTGYPQVRQADIEATQMKCANSVTLARPVIPSLGRAYHLRGRNEASRRATQLAYALHLHKAQTGAWPATLSDLPEEFGETVRTDPFTGQHFGYQLTESGPKIYTLGEDGLDSGGVHSKSWGGDRKSPEDSDDYVFWPPQ